MYYYGADREKAARAIIDDYRYAASLFTAIRKVFAAYDGKMYNKRIETALRGISGASICQEKREGYAGFYLWKNGKSFSLCYGKRDDLLTDEKRVNSSAWIANASEKRAEYLKKAADMEISLQDIDCSVERIKQLKQAIGAIKKDIPYEIRDIYGIA